MRPSRFIRPLHYVEVLPEISNYGLLIINANTKGKKFIKELEKQFHIAYKPKLNFPKGFPSTYKPLNYDHNFMEGHWPP